MNRHYNLLLTDQRHIATAGEAIIEHVNLTVSDPERTSAMLQSIFGWHERWRGIEPDGRIGIHVGGTGSYVALYPPRTPIKDDIALKSRPFNHVGVVVRGLKEAERRVKAHGFTPWGHGDYEPGQRFYFNDWDAVEYEIVAYDG